MDTGFVMNQIFAVIACVFLFFQLYGTYYVVSSHPIGTRQKVRYLLLIWLVPLIGCLLVLNWLLPDEIEFQVMSMQSPSQQEDGKQKNQQETSVPRDHENVI